MFLTLGEWYPIPPRNLRVLVTQLNSSSLFLILNGWVWNIKISIKEMDQQGSYQMEDQGPKIMEVLDYNEQTSVASSLLLCKMTTSHS